MCSSQRGCHHYARFGSTLLRLVQREYAAQWYRFPQHYFCKGDTLHWLERFAKQGRLFDAIVLDPPTFSRDAKGRIWRVEKDYAKLVAKAKACLAPGGWMLCTTNCRKLSPADFRNMVAQGAPGAKLTTSAMTFDFDGEQYLKTVWVDA